MKLVEQITDYDYFINEEVEFERLSNLFKVS